MPIRYLDEGYSPYSDGNYRRVTIENNEETFKEESNNEEVQVTKPHQVIDNIVSCSVLFDNAKHRLPQVGSQSYVDEILKKESSNLDIADEALPREANREDVQANEEHVQVGTNLDLLPVDIRVTQRVGPHVDFFFQEGFFDKIEHHSIFTWLLALNNILRSEIKIYIEIKLILISSSSILLHFKTRGRVFSNQGRIMQNKCKEWLKICRKLKYFDIGDLLYFFIIFVGKYH